MKRFLDALRAEPFQIDVFSSFMEAFTSLVKCNLSAEVFRSLALFVTYALHKPSVSAIKTPKSRHGTVTGRSAKPADPIRRPGISTDSDGKQGTATILTKRQIGTGILEMYTELLCEKGSTTNLKKFARTVTNKVCICLKVVISKLI